MRKINSFSYGLFILLLMVAVNTMSFGCKSDSNSEPEETIIDMDIGTLCEKAKIELPGSCKVVRSVIVNKYYKRIYAMVEVPDDVQDKVLSSIQKNDNYSRASLGEFGGSLIRWGGIDIKDVDVTYADIYLPETSSAVDFKSVVAIMKPENNHRIIYIMTYE